MRRIGKLRLTPEEIAYFVMRVRTSSKARPDGANGNRASATIAISAAAKALSLRKTCAPSSGGIAFMDHSDGGIRKLVERSGIPWEEPTKRHLSAAERILAGIISFVFALMNWGPVRQSLVVGSDAVDAMLAEDRFVAGSGCFARFLAQGLLARNSLHGLFVTGDVSFLRMFACFAAIRLDIPISVLLPHRQGPSSVHPIAVDRLFTLDVEAARNFDPRPRTTVVEPVTPRRRQILAAGGLELGILTDNFVDVEQVWATARAFIQHPSVSSVRIRLHPGSIVSRLPQGMPPTVTLESNETLEVFSERIDVAIVSASTAVPRLQELLVPCFHMRSLYSELDAWGRRDPTHEVSWLYPTPELSGSVRDFLDSCTNESLTRETEALRRATARTRSSTGKELVRAELEAFLQT